ncbi:endolytic transglycosylase MltG [Bacillus kwashiorkori]|uniref:endolytic transglycosylase MltG n=1 Tax=Bacillus kwashiorkori TaxID=1522318 RepID=UPI0007824301|nr:endolytic transglycosylase MltG [Bacillus kwashiorkori]
MFKMDKLTVFAAGLLLSSSIFGIVYLSNNDDTNTANAANYNSTEAQKQSLSETEMKDQLLNKGYVVLTQDEYQQNLAKAKAEVATVTKEDKTSNKKEEVVEKDEKEDKVTKVTITVKSGMTSYDIGKILNDKKLIKQTPFEFSKEIEKRGLDKTLQLGKYTVDSTMSYNEIIQTIFEK